MPETRNPIHLSGQSLATLAAQIDARAGAPVDKWNPTHCGDSEMRIARDGTWYHQGTPITRDAMVRLFSHRFSDESRMASHVLVTPVEKLTIEVENTAFRALEMTMEGKYDKRSIAFRLDSGDAVIVGSDHPLRVIETGQGLSPRLVVRHGLEAELALPLYLELADIALSEGHDPPGVWSSGAFFSLEPGGC